MIDATPEQYKGAKLNSRALSAANDLHSYGGNSKATRGNSIKLPPLKNAPLASQSIVTGGDGSIANKPSRAGVRTRVTDI